jgi:LPXTG-motif cell wall-anchored protein
MTGDQTNSKAMIVGFALVATGGLISMCGIGITGTVMVTAFRRWIRAQQEPPAIVVKRKIAQAKAATTAATTAGSSAWQNGLATSRTR